MRQQQLSIYCRIRTQLSRHSVSSAALVTLALIVLASPVILFVDTSSLRVLNSLGDMVGVHGDQLNNVAHGFKTTGWDVDTDANTNADSTPTPTPTPPSVILSEDFESGALDPRISIQITGAFSSGPGIKSISNFGSTKAFGFGRSTCGASCFSNFVTTLRITLPTPTFVSNINFKEMELFDNWGSQGFLIIDGVRFTDSPADFGRFPLNDRQTDTTFRARTFTINRTVTIIELRVEDITSLSEIYIDDLVITGGQEPTPTPTPTPPNVILAADFESGTLDPRISVQITGTFSVVPGIKNVSNFGSAKAFGFGRSTCGASCFSNYVTTLRITLPAPTFVSNINFKEIELFDNWGSRGLVLIDGGRLTNNSDDFGKLPYNDRQADTTFRSKNFPINRTATFIELRVEDITSLSEIYIDDLVITGGQEPTPTPTPLSNIVWFDNFESSPVGAFPAGWSNSGNTNVAIDNVTYVSPSQCARLTGDSFGCWEALIHRPLNTSPPFTFEAFVYTRPQTMNGCHSWRASFFLNTGASWTTPNRQLLFFDGDLAIKGSGGLVLGPYVPQTWYKIKIAYERLNASTVRLSYWINDLYKGVETLGAASYENQLSYLTLASGDGPAWFDDVKVTTGTPFSSTLSLLGITPNKGGDTGSVTVTLNGTGFDPGATVRLVRAGSEIIGTGVTVIGERTNLEASFDLTGKARGTWDVVVRNPEGSSDMIPGGFNIEPGRAAQMSVEVVGFNVIRADRTQTFHVFYSNKGNVDAVGVPLWIAGIPANAQYRLGFDVEDPPQGAGEPPVDWTAFSGVLVRGGEVFIPLLIPHIAAGATGVLSFSINIPPTVRQFQLRAWANPPLFRSQLSQEFVDCFFDVLGLVSSLAPPVSCVLAVAQPWAEQFVTGRSKKPFWWAKWLADIARDCIPGAKLSDIVEAIRDTMNWILDRTAPISSCSAAFSQESPSSLPVQQIASFDPNNKVGSRGGGQAHFLSGREPLQYSILFENLENATAPAQTVVIEDLLDASMLDLNTLSLGPISFGKWRVTPPPGLSNYSTMVDLRSANNLLVRVDAALNKTTGLLRWTFTSLDPGTELPTQDPLAGFLPPNKIPPEGEGAVLFTVSPKSVLTTGTEVRNKARIVFDANPPIDTPEWLNTLDNTNPVSHVAPLSAQSPHSFQVNWSGSDIGSGLLDFTVFVSENGGPFTTWLINTSATSAIFYGKASTTYAFYSLARDAVGNHESAKTIAEATTTTPPPFQLLWDESGPASNQAAALDSILFLRDPFPIVNGADLFNLGVDRNTRVIIFLTNLQLAQGETSSSLVVNLIDSNNQSYDIAAEDVRPVPNFNFTQVIFRLPDNLPVGTCTIKVKAHGQISNAGTIRIRI